MQNPKNNGQFVDRYTFKLTRWIGTPFSILLHTIFFAGMFLLEIFGLGLEKILLILTTLVSLEAIYLSIFIQMSVNRNEANLQEVEADIEEISGDIEDLGEDVDEISEDLDKIQEREIVDEQQEASTKVALGKIETGLQKLLADIEALKSKNLF